MRSGELAEAAWNARAEPERHVLGVGYPVREGTVYVGVAPIADGHNMCDRLTLDWPGGTDSFDFSRYRLELVKVEEES
jgi:hypothetical protein